MKETPVTFRSKNKQIVGILHLPNRKKSPVIIMCHGFTGSKIGTAYGLFVQAAREFCKKGFAVLRFDFRGSGDSEGKFEDQTIETEVEDTKSALGFVKKIPTIDKNKIGIIGFSRGGAVAIIAASMYKGIKCLVTWASVADFKPLWFKREIQKLKQEGYYFNHKGFKITKTLWQSDLKWNATKYAWKITVPFLILHGTLDRSVPVTHARILFKNANEPKKLQLIKASNHLFFKSSHREQLINYTVDWFNKWLK